MPPLSETDKTPAPAETGAPAPLAGLRARIDALDDRLHDMLIERSELIERVRNEGGKTGVLIRPGREAVILRRLLGRHRGALPPQAIMRIWRELFSAALMIEGDLTIAVADGPQMDITSLAREHFGPLTPLRRHPTPAQAMADLTSAAAQVAVLPLPSPADDAAGSWWIGLMQCGAPRLQIVARLPFWAPRPEGTPQAGAYVVGALEPDASGADRSLLGLEIAADASTAKVTAALKEAGFSVGSLLQRRLPRQETAYALADVEGLVSRSDPRLAAITGLASKPELLGGYAVPVPPPGEMAEPA